jgi:integrase
MTKNSTPRIPKYRLHKPSGLAVVRLNGKDIYMGPHGSDASRQHYARIIQEWLANNRLVVPADDLHDGPPDLTVNELVLPYLEHAKAYYVKNGRPTREADNIKDAVKPLVELYGELRISAFGPRALKAVRQAMIDADLCRKTINNRIHRIRRMFRWGVENQMVSPQVLDGLLAVASLRPGRTAARETKPIEPVPQHLIDAVLQVAPRQIAAMVQLQLLTGMRPGEVTMIRAAELDMTGRMWAYAPQSHKTEHHGRNRVVYLGPKAQEVLRPFLKPNLTTYVFSPAEVVAEYRKDLRENAKTCRPAHKLSNRRKRARRGAGERYTTNSYGRVIVKACDKAFPPPNSLQGDNLTKQQLVKLKAWRNKHRFSPNQLRHNAATAIRNQFGIEAARTVLGHGSAAVTEIYAAMDLARAAEVMARIG